MGGNDSTTKFSTAVTKRKTNTKQVPMLNSMFEVDISDNERDNKHTQRNRMSQLRQIQKFGTIKNPWRSNMRLTILVQCRYLKKQPIQGMNTQQKGISKKNLQKSSAAAKSGSCRRLYRRVEGSHNKTKTKDNDRIHIM